MKMMNIDPNALTREQKEDIYIFIKKYIPQGTVDLPETIYNTATNWTILYASDKKTIVGFSAQKYFNLGYFTLVQIMATFMAEVMRGKRLAAILIQGQPFWNQFIRNPKKPIYWCTRTRVPSAYAASTKYNDVFPKINSLNKNLSFSDFAEFIARQVYGSHIEFEKSTYKIINSYAAECIFKELPYKKNQLKGNITDYFLKNINYDKNEAIFIVSKTSRFSIIKYFLMKTLSKISFLQRTR